MSEIRVKKLNSFLPIEALQSKKPSKKELLETAKREAEILMKDKTPLEVWIAALQMQDYLQEISETVKPKAIEQAIENLPEKGKTIEIGHIKVTVAGGTQKEEYDYTASQDWQNLKTMLEQAEAKVKEIKARMKALEMTLALELPVRLVPDKPSLRLQY